MSASVNPANLAYIRRQRLIDLTELSEFTGIARSSLEKFEEGDREPTSIQAEKLAGAFGVPVYQLYWSNLPNLEPLPQDYRRTDPGAADLSPKGLRAIFDSQRSATFAQQLLPITGFSGMKLDANIAEAQGIKKKARELREAFSEWFGIREKRLDFYGDKAHVTLGALRLFFEIHGRIAQVNDAPSDDYFGFFLQPEKGVPAVFVNRSIQSKKSQLFTFSHEYCHYFLDKEGISNPFDAKNEIERRCNRFAAEFIAPEKSVIQIYDDAPIGIRTNASSIIKHISQRSLLSLHATAIRLKELEILSSTEANMWLRRHTTFFRQEKSDEASEQSFGPPHARRISEIGHLPIYLAKLAIERGAIDRFDVAETLKLSFSIQEKAFDLVARRIDVAVS